MALNPLMLMQLKKSWETFVKNHPKFPLFCQTVYKTGLQEGTILECKVTTPDGKELTSNIRICQEDLALLKQLQEMASK